MISLSELATPFLALSLRLKPLLTMFVKSFNIQAIVRRHLKMTFLSLGLSWKLDFGTKQSPKLQNSLPLFSIPAKIIL